MLPVYHPTTVLVVDDDTQYLDSFEYRYGRDFIIRTMKSPEEALAAIDDSQHRWQGRSHVAVASRSDHDHADDDAMLRGAGLPAIAQDPHRFSTISVVVVDFAMPSMTGVEFCRRIKDLPVKKLLLTGMTGNDTAVAAFNEGIIDCFLVKQDPALNERMPLEISRLQQAFFKVATIPYELATDQVAGGLLKQPAVIASVQDQLRRHHAVEHYVMLSEPGAAVLMADAHGAIGVVLIYDEECMRALVETAQEEGAPTELIEALKERKVLARFPTKLGLYTSEFVSTWRRYMAPAQRLQTSVGECWVAVVSGQHLGPHMPARIGHATDVAEGPLNR